MNSKKDMKEIINFLKNSGFVFQGSEIYGGLANTWDYGPLGIELIKNLKNLWWREFILKEESNYGLDSKILMNPKVWEASGHLGNFSDPLIENKINGKRYRADNLIQAFDDSINAENMSKEEMTLYIKENIMEFDGSKTDWTDIREFHLMFETKQGVVQGDKSLVYLRPETAQGIFINFKNVQRSMRSKLPMGIGQIGKSFRNEVTPGNFIFRTREFEQMELEVFVHPEKDDETYKYYIEKSVQFLKLLGLKETSFKLKKHEAEELAHYSKGTTDIEFEFPFGWGELLGVSNRTNFDLNAHMKHSNQSLEYLDPITNKKFVPHVIEPSIGVDRLMLAILVDSYEVEKLESSERMVMKLDKNLAPYRVAVMPLSKKHHSDVAKKLFNKLIDEGISATYDSVGSIGKRYRRQDSIGTPFVITVIDETKSKEEITIRFRDDMTQKTILINELNKHIF